MTSPPMVSENNGRVAMRAAQSVLQFWIQMRTLKIRKGGRKVSSNFSNKPNETAHSEIMYGHFAPLFALDKEK